jgi:hypothetical protein
MTVNNFSHLPKVAKKHLLLKTGAYIAERKWGFFRVMLYQVNNFYTEVFFLPWNRKVFLFRSFTSTNKLAPYLKKIDVSSILQEVAH